MRAYLGINNTEESLSIDCITLTNEETDETLNLSFCEHDCFKTSTGIGLRAKDAEDATFGLPASLEGKFGNNAETYQFLSKCKLESIVLHLMEEKEEYPSIVIEDLTELNIIIGEQSIEFTDFEGVEIEW